MNDTRLVMERGMWGATGNYYFGLLEFADMGFVLHALRPGDLFVDVGANVGAYSVLAASVGARVIAVEPIPVAAERLRRNVLINGFEPQVWVESVGLASANGTLRFTSGDDTNNRVATYEDARTTGVIDVPVVRLDDLMAHGSPSVLKIDVEGFEKDVLDGGATTLADPNLAALVVETSGHGARYGFDDQEVHRTIVDTYRFVPVSYDPFSRHLTATHAPSVSENTIYVRDIELMQERLTMAPRFNVLGRQI